MARPTRSLEELEAEHASSVDPATRSSIRYSARRAAERLGVAVPAWAVSGQAEPPPPRPVAPEQARSPFEDIEPCAPPPELRAWREAQPGRIVTIGIGGVSLRDLCAETRWYPTIAAALEALTLPAE